MRKTKRKIGDKIGKLTIVGFAAPEIDNYGTKRTCFYCDCDCGNKNIIISTKKLGHTQSCGCLQSEILFDRNKKYNTYNLSGEYGIGYTNKGEPFYFDLEDYEKIKDYCWYKDFNGYIRACRYDSDKKRIGLHNVIIDGHADHIGGEETRNDNRKINLRTGGNKYSFYTYNNMNIKTRSTNKSGVTGVCWDKRKNKWKSYISINHKTISLGSYDNFEDAVFARKEAEEKYFGEYSYDNSQKQAEEFILKEKIK